MEIMNLAELNDTEVVAMLIAGLLLMVAGYKIKKIAFFIIWFLLGFSLMGYLTPLLIHIAPEVLNNAFWETLLPIAGGLLLALMGLTVEKICVSGIVFGLTLAITAQYFGTSMQTMLLGGVVGVVLAGAASMLMKPATIIATAIAGAYTLTMAVLHWGTEINAEAMYFPILFGGAAVGAVIQFLTTKHDS